MKERRRVEGAYLHVWITLHYFLNPGQREYRVFEIHCFLLSCVYLALPELTEEVVELGARLDIGRRRGRHSELKDRRQECNSRNNLEQLDTQATLLRDALIDIGSRT